MQELIEKEIFIEAQNQTILQLSKQVQALEADRDRLKTLLDSSIPILSLDQGQELPQEFICKIEIQKLKNISMQRDLLTDEAKRLQIYVDVLAKCNTKDKQKEKEVSKLNDDELIRLIENKP